MTSGDLFSDVTMAPKMLARGKLPMIPRVIRGRREMKRLFAACRKEAAK
jgi:hypothetical protein